MVLEELSSIYALEAIIFFMAVLVGWFAVYFLEEALRSVEKFTSKRIYWRYIYLVLPLILVRPIALVSSVYYTGAPLSGAGDFYSSIWFLLGSIVLFFVLFDFRRHVEFTLVSKGTMLLAFAFYFLINLSLISQFQGAAFGAMIVNIFAFAFLAASLWYVASYTRDFSTIYPMPTFLVVSALILLVSQVIRLYEFVSPFSQAESTIVAVELLRVFAVFVGFLVAAISTYVFKKTVIEFSLNIGVQHLSPGMQPAPQAVPAKKKAKKAGKKKK